MDNANAPNWGNIITWLLVFIGWVAVHFMALARERRKEKRDLAKSISTTLRDIEQAAIDLHTADNFNLRKDAELRDRINRAIIQLQRPPMCELRLPSKPLFEFRQSITLTNSSPNDFTAQLPDAELIIRIKTAADDLIDDLEERKERIWA